MSASEDGYGDMVKKLLMKGADVTKRDEDRNTALSLAKNRGNDAIVAMLIDANKGNKEQKEVGDQDSDDRIAQLEAKMAEMQDTLNSIQLALQEAKECKED